MPHPVYVSLVVSERVLSRNLSSVPEKSELTVKDSVSGGKLNCTYLRTRHSATDDISDCRLVVAVGRTLILLCTAAWFINY